MSAETTPEKRKLQSYPSPLNVRKVMALSEKHQISQSKIVNDALTMYFNAQESSKAIFLNNK